MARMPPSLRRTTRLSSFILPLLAAATSRLCLGGMALAPARRAAFRRGFHARSAPSCIDRATCGQLLDSCSSHTIANPGPQLSRSTSQSTMVFSSATRSGSGSSSKTTPGAMHTSDAPREEQSWSHYERLVRKLYMTNLFNPVKLGLENMDRLHKALGSPMDQPNISIVHIAGSNGKGSVALKTAHTLQLANYKVGLFVSPHISSFRERIQINGEPISEAQVERYLQEIFDICEREDIPATFFEVTTALAFHIFAKEGVEAVVLETGLGGRLDATNVIASPALSIITSIGLEHTRILGDTVEAIALEKGGIIKEGCPVLVGKNVPLDVLQKCAEEKNASNFYQCEDVLGPSSPAMVEGSKEAFEDYDVENSRIASAALVLLQFHLTQQKLERNGEDVKLIAPKVIEQGVKIRPPCRFEEMDIPTAITAEDGSTAQKIVRVILDVAHNPQAMEYLIVKLRANYPSHSNQRIVVGMSADKDLRHCTETLLEHVAQRPEKLHLVEASHPRAASISSILEANPTLIDSHYDAPKEDELNEHGRDTSSVSKQVRAALQLAARNDELLVVCGSVFIMADAREELGIVEPRDSAVISEVAGAGLRSSQENFGGSGNEK
ncbi:hypothetical protein ACHAXT_002194 [Thalassiosira profunda]